MGKNPDVSVIVPIYNVEEYLEECLDCLKNQTLENIEVIMVDDDTPDSSGEIAQRYAQMYPNFRYFHKENGGLGCARNFGVKYATGKYIAFIDSDDVVSEDLYEKMFLCAERHKSELTICNVVRFNSKSTWATGLHQRVFKDLDTNTHITKSPSLLYDTISCNKLILRSFYEKNNFAFPENILYEDIPVTVPMHFLANNVSVVESSYYFWRVRDGVTKSITQNSDSLDNFYDRLKIMRMLDDLLNKLNVDEQLVKLNKKKYLEIDLMIFVNNCKSIPNELAMEMLKGINEYIDEAIEDDVFSLLPLLSQQKYRYVREYNVEKLIELLEFQKSGYYYSKIEEKDGRFFATLPDNLFSIESREVTQELAEYNPRKSITEVTVDDESLEIKGYIFHSRVNISDVSQQKFTAYLQNEITEELTPIPIETIIDEDVTERNGTQFEALTENTSIYNYNASSFKIRIDLNELDINEANLGYNKVIIFYENRLVKRKVWLSSYHKASSSIAVFLDDKYVRLEYDAVKELRVLLRKENIVAQNLFYKGKRITVVLNQNVDKLYAVNAKDERIEFERIEENKFASSRRNFETDLTYRLYYEVNGIENELLYRKKKVIIKAEYNPAVLFMMNFNHRVRFILKDRITVINNTEQNENVLNFETTAVLNKRLANAKTAKLYVEDKVSGERVVLAKSDCEINDKFVNCEFSVDFNDEEITKNFYASTRDMFVVYENEKTREIGIDPVHASKKYNLFVNLETIQIYLFRGGPARSKLKISKLWSDDERTHQRRKALLAENYSKYLKEPIEPKTILFEATWGRKYWCNPQYIYEYIDKNYPDYKCVWSLEDEKIPIKGNGIRVRRGSLEYYHYLATAKYLFNNVNFPPDFIKRDEQVFVQTMHGTPLKTFGLEVPGELPTEHSRQQFIEKANNWNYLLAQGEFMKNKADDCFKYRNKILEVGYPRTDILFNVSDEKVKKLKKQLRIPLDKKVILYTPTWRKRGVFDMDLDIEKMREALSDEYVLLVRLHYLCAPNDYIQADNEFVFDLHAYRSVEDLYLISDILITDYSSVMFDYALLNKPMLFYLYDLVDYRDNLRGMYVDIENEAPGPIVYDTTEIINTVKNVDKEMEKCSDKVKAFKEKFLSYENGNSCEMLVNTVINPKGRHIKKAKRLLKKLFN